MRFFFILVLFFQVTISLSQETNEEVVITCECTIVLDDDTKPMFPGGNEALQYYLKMNAVYPEEAFENKEQGTVYIRFVVNSDGAIQDAKVIKSVSPSLDKEALRVVRSMPKWIPGEQAGKRIRVRYELPINFRLV